MKTQPTPLSVPFAADWWLIYHGWAQNLHCSLLFIMENIGSDFSISVDHITSNRRVCNKTLLGIGGEKIFLKISPTFIHLLSSHEWKTYLGQDLSSLVGSQRRKRETFFYPQGAHILVIYNTVWYMDPGSSIGFQRGLGQLGGQGALRGSDIWILKVGRQCGSEGEGQRNHQRTGSQKEEHMSSRQDYWSLLGTQKYPLMATHVRTSKILNNLFIT